MKNEFYLTSIEGYQTIYQRKTSTQHIYEYGQTHSEFEKNITVFTSKKIEAMKCKHNKSNWPMSQKLLLT